MSPIPLKSKALRSKALASTARLSASLTSTRSALRALCLLMLASLAACTQTTHSGPASDQLYRDFGGQPGIERLIDGLLDNIARDDRIFPLFRDANIDRLRSKLIEKFCSLTGGPCTYTGASIVDAHSGRQITEAQFNALVEDLIDAMEEQRIAVATQNRLIAILAPMRPEVIRR